MSSSGILSFVPDLTTVCALFTVLHGLALLAIKNEVTKQLITDDLLDSFANNKAQHCKLMA